jgi:hypothetical protein
MAIASGSGARVTLPGAGAAAVFGEAGGRVLLSVAPQRTDELRRLIGDVPLVLLGEAGGDELRLAVADVDLAIGLGTLRESWERDF